MRDWRKPQAPTLRKNDLEMLSKLLAESDLDPSEREAFTDMQRHLRDRPSAILTEKQRAWVRGVLVRFEPQYENLVSSGKVSNTTKVETIDLLKRENLPLRPPGRR